VKKKSPRRTRKKVTRGNSGLEKETATKIPKKVEKWGKKKRGEKKKKKKKGGVSWDRTHCVTGHKRK